MATLYIVATPIGNLADMSFRGIEVLKNVSVVFAEDTRVTKKLFNHFGIETKLESLNARTEAGKSGRVLAALEKGDVAYVSDAGTPGISDPGSLLVSRVREVLPDVQIVPIPGASALAAFLSVAGIPAASFIFLGFLPHKKGRETLFKEIADAERTVIFYESPHRIMKTLESLEKHIQEDRTVVVGRELTKIYEEIVVGDATYVRTYFMNNIEKQRGEFVVAVAPN